MPFSAKFVNYIINTIKQRAPHYDQEEILYHLNNFPINLSVDEKAALLQWFIMHAIQSKKPAAEELRQNNLAVLYNNQITLPNIIPLSITNIFNIKNTNELQLAFNPESAYRYGYVCMNSAFKNDAQSTPSRLSWIYSTQINQPAIGYVYSNQPIVNIQSMRLYKLIMPYNFIGRDRLLTTRSTTILIEEFNTQITAFVDTLRYHFIGEYQPQTTSPVFLPSAVFSNDPQGMTFYFRQPIQQFSSLTLTFGNPDQQIEFYPIEYTAVVTYVSTDIIFTFAKSIPLTSIVEHVNVTNFTADNLIVEQEINRAIGIYLVRVSNTVYRYSSTSITIPPDHTVTVRFTALQLLAYLEFSYVPDD